MNDNEKAERVRRFLLLPIRKDEHIKYNEDGIMTTQTYLSGFDYDMSDISVQFYKIIYGIDILDDKGQLMEKQFAGDTMCSFNTIANCVDGAGKSTKQRTPYEQWPKFLQDYYDSYHCLANFWVLPLWAGRSYPNMPQEHKWASKTGAGDGINIQDYMDRYLSFLQNNYPKFIKHYVEYGREFSSFSDFAYKHYLRGEENYISKGGKINLYSQQKDPEAVVNSMNEKIKERAKAISESSKCNDLYKWILELEVS